MTATETHPDAGWPLLDIGGDVGALVVYAEQYHHGAEIHLRPVVTPEQIAHNVVRARPAGAGTCFAAVFPSLPAGEYLVLAHSSAPDGQRVAVCGAAVSELRWAAPTDPDALELDHPPDRLHAHDGLAPHVHL